MKKQIKIILILICFLVFFFCLSGVFMAGSFSVPAPIEQKDYYVNLISVYMLGTLLSFLVIMYLSFFVKTKND